MAVETTGHLRDWTQAANMLFAPGCEAQGFALLCSIASPLLPLLAKPRGLVCSLWGGSKSGKSTALTAGASVWGLGEEADAGWPVIQDNFVNADIDRLRTRLDEYVDKRKPARVWIVFSRIPLWPEIANSPSSNFPYGIELEVKVPKTLIVPKDKNHIEYQLSSNAGCAGYEIMQYLERENARTWVRRQFTSSRNALYEMGMTAGRAADIIATVHVAAVMATSMQILDCSPERMRKWAKEQVQVTPPPQRAVKVGG